MNEHSGGEASPPLSLLRSSEQRRQTDSPVVIYEHTHTHTKYRHMYTCTRPQNLVWFDKGAASCSVFLHLVVVLSWTALTLSLRCLLPVSIATHAVTRHNNRGRSRTKQNLNTLKQGVWSVSLPKIHLRQHTRILTLQPDRKSWHQYANSANLTIYNF